MNELLPSYTQRIIQEKLRDTVDPPEPKQKGVRLLNIPLSRYATRIASSEDQEKIATPLEKIKKYLRNQLPKNPRNDELQQSVGFEFSATETFQCKEHTETVFFSVPPDKLLSSQSPDELNRRLNRFAMVTKADAARILSKPESEISEDDLNRIKQEYELPPTAEAVVKFYVHELPKPPEQARQGMDLIVFGGGATEALGNIGFAGQIARELENNDQLKGKVGRIIVMPHLAGSTKTGKPFNPTMTKDFGPAAQVMIQALKQAGIKLSPELCIVGHSAGANMSILMAEGLIKSDPNVRPRLLLLEPAIGEIPAIDKRTARTGLIDPWKWARTLDERNQRLNRLQALQYTLRTVMNGWGTQEGPAGWGIVRELLRRRPFEYMTNEARAAGLDEIAGGVPNVALLSADSSAKARESLVEKNVPVNFAYTSDSTTVDPLSESQRGDRKSLQAELDEIQEQLDNPHGLTPYELYALKKKQQLIDDKLKRNQALFRARAEALFSPENVMSVTIAGGGSHFDVLWKRAALAKALLATLN